MQKKFYFKINQLPLEGTTGFIYTLDEKPLSAGEAGVGEFITIWANNETEACQKKNDRYVEKTYLSMNSFYVTIFDPIGEYLLCTELKPNSIIMIENIDGSTDPYFVHNIKIGSISQATMILGHKLAKLIKHPGLYPCSRIGLIDKFYIPNGNVRKQNEGVKGYRFLNKIEMNEWQNKIKPIVKLEPLQKLLV